ncbi:uncharacterized protein N0V89_007600 [Didymosphaeria variabile]|uniref:Uncharacterized protein n=1 Tax=Didymosphaeria variabile TaxID=1932322 RepID=A0A9W9CAF1_9PLEO|nr:uncharacterized protein N0V89_007600 [Didymosphaeria variabile]KAJ4352253.1 hypothetical protein N0V89_007600 [Didymosphaeria variabile]
MPASPGPSPLSSPRKLQRRPTAKETLNTKLITHLQTIEVSEKAPAVGAPKPQFESRRRVLASDMRTTPFPASPFVQTLAWNVFLTPEQAYSLVMGFRPKETEDKWFIYSQGPDHSGKLKVHFHRSWTGMKIAELFVLIDLKGEGAGKIVGIKWDGSDQTNGLEQEEVKYMVSTACAFVLGVKLDNGVL